jgi:membrane-associated phospholipid phosphatase
MISTILERLKSGTVELSPAFDPRARWIYAIVALQCSAGALLLWWFGYSLDASVWQRLPIVALPLALSGMLARRYGHPRFGGAVEVIALTYLQAVATVFLLFPLTEISLPFADPAFAAVDQALGFRWPDFALVFAHDQQAYQISEFIYYSMEWQALLIVPLLFLMRQELRAWRFVTTGALAALMVVIIYPFVPAEGPAVFYGLVPADLPSYGLFPWEFGPKLEQIRDGNIKRITLEWIFAMVSLPSYHAASAVAFTWAMWPSRWLRWPFALLNIGVGVTSIYVGIHYLVDILAGIAVACVAIGLACRLVTDRAATAD